jgi:hypothetical protein
MDAEPESLIAVMQLKWIDQVSWFTGNGILIRFIRPYGYITEFFAFDLPRSLKSKIAPIAVPSDTPIAKL